MLYCKGIGDKCKMKEKFTVTGMSCAACSAGIDRTLNKAEGVRKAEVSLMGESMVVEYDERKISREKIIQAVVNLGYGAKLFDENVLRERKPQPDLLKKRFLKEEGFHYMKKNGSYRYCAYLNHILHIIL